MSGFCTDGECSRTGELCGGTDNVNCCEDLVCNLTGTGLGLCVEVSQEDSF